MMGRAQGAGRTAEELEAEERNGKGGLPVLSVRRAACQVIDFDLRSLRDLFLFPRAITRYCGTDDHWRQLCSCDLWVFLDLSAATAFASCSSIRERPGKSSSAMSQAVLSMQQHFAKAGPRGNKTYGKTNMRDSRLSSLIGRHTLASSAGQMLHKAAQPKHTVEIYLGSRRNINQMARGVSRAMSSNDSFRDFS